MEQQELKKKITNVLDNYTVGTLATVKNNRPHSRYMSFSNEGFTFYTPTDKETHKMEEIEANPYVHILLGYQGEGDGDPYVEVEGKAKIREDQKIKEWLWTERMSRWFTSSGDQNYIALEIEPETIRLMNADGDTPETLEL
ncbi:pyridoxamine 5'-phosphate oxidase family protein [Thalassobacillus sp. CUG 92003]|uniref:pyridoxamine 5'-phosphate oxidase family protein n=1 Tax=Thalassobacillus sp. CUG 92003 TaxID=2736641 RepID=UPI0015E6A3F2|nr:pyridoxamine 5'-phosphate oxidase family protein [Thalassobacillus sp. CUG 92003]